MASHAPQSTSPRSGSAELETPAPSAALHTLDLLRHASWYGALTVAWIAMCGSLFFSEVLGWLPCVLCWYQRILMYPLTVILAVGILRGDTRLHGYVLPLSTLGASVSLYHYLLVKTDWLPPPPCVAGIPCTVEYVNWFGFINIPFLALTAFVIISFLAVAMALSASAATERVADADEPAPAQPIRQITVLLTVASIIGAVITAFWIAARFV